MARRRTQSPPLSPTPVSRNQSIPPIVTANRRSHRIIHPRHFYGDTPTPSPPQAKLCSRHQHMKPLADYIDINTGEQYDVCKDCRADVEYTRQQAAEMEAQMQLEEEELQRLFRNGIKIFYYA
jgi:hypothetical protein